MDDRAAVCWLHRRAGFGLALPALNEAIARGPAAEIESMLAASAIAAAVAADPWNDADLPLERDKATSIAAITTWLDHLVATTTPLVDRMAWLWHGHFVSALDKVKIARLMVDQIRLFRREGLGSFALLLKAVTIDPAMLLYLDGATSTGAHPNENFSREVMELFTLGVGHFAEADVPAGAAALSGWRVQRAAGTADFVARRHDDTPQTYLGANSVHDVDSVVAAITSQPALGQFIATRFASEFLGVRDPAVIGGLANTFTSSSLDISALARATLQAGVAGNSQSVVLAPVPWMVMAQRITGGVIKPKARLAGLRTAGQIPMSPPNVAGWPGGAAWFGTSTVVARAGLASAIAASAPDDNPARVAASGSDHVALATALGLPTPSFGAATSAALDAASPGAQRLALALCSPEFVVA